MSLSVSTKFGKVDRGRRPRGSLPEPGADEEQPLGGERKMHPALEETNRPTLPQPFNFTHADQHTPTDDP